MQELALASLVHCLAWEIDGERGIEWKLPGWEPHTCCQVRHFKALFFPISL